jgi:hypothetical protein
MKYYIHAFASIWPPFDEEPLFLLGVHHLLSLNSVADGRRIFDTLKSPMMLRRRRTLDSGRAPGAQRLEVGNRP